MKKKAIYYPRPSFDDNQSLLRWANQLIDTLKNRELELLYDLNYSDITLTDGTGITITATSPPNINYTIDWDGLTVRKNTGSNIGSQPRLNLIEGSNITLTITNDATGNEIDVTIQSDITYLDNFFDDSLHWTWLTHNTDANRTITESGGVLTIAITNGTNGNWWNTVNNAPKAIIGINGYPCSIETKMNSYTVNDETTAGIFLAYDPKNIGANLAYYFGRQRKDSTSENGLVWSTLGTQIGINSETTLPIWLRIRATAGAYYGAKFFFDYSTDGENWTNAYSWENYYEWGYTTGLFVKNWNVLNAISVPFEYFKITQEVGPR